jgi:hypothetical protein
VIEFPVADQRKASRPKRASDQPSLL